MKVSIRPDAAASFFWFFQKPKKDIACSGTGGFVNTPVLRQKNITTI